MLRKKMVKFAKIDDPQDFWGNFLWTDETKAELFRRFSSVTTQHFFKKNPINCLFQLLKGECKTKFTN